MNIGYFSKSNFMKVESFLRNNNAPQCLLEELYGYASYFKDPSWSEKATYVSCTNGAYIGKIKNGEFHGVGMYVYNNGDVYIGDWVNGNHDGYGFYYDYSECLVYWGEWKNDKKKGHGHIWGPGYESEGMYANDEEMSNMYVRNGGNYSQKNTDDSSEGGCLFLFVLGVVIYILVELIS